MLNFFKKSFKFDPQGTTIQKRLTDILAHLINISEIMFETIVNSCF